MEKNSFESCENLVNLESSKPLINFLNRLRDGKISDGELKLLARLVGEADFKLPKEQTTRNFIVRGIYEKIRGSQAATESGVLRPKRDLMEGVFDLLKGKKIITNWFDITKSGRTDYLLTSGRSKVYIEAKGGLDGNSTKISDAPKDAAEVWKWFMCEGSPENAPPSQVQKNRLINDMMRKMKTETGFIVLDYLCGNSNIRPCPKNSNARLSILQMVQSPFPDIFLFPQFVEMRNGEFWSKKQAFDYSLVVWFSNLWNLKEKELAPHVHFIGLEVMDDKLKKYRWLIRSLDKKEIWYKSAIRTVK